MTLHITRTAMGSDLTRHTARAVARGWEVSWLPGRRLGREQAVTALLLAETAVVNKPRPGDRWWPHVTNWARELGLDAEDAIARVRGGAR